MGEFGDLQQFHLRAGHFTSTRGYRFRHPKDMTIQTIEDYSYSHAHGNLRMLSVVYNGDRRPYDLSYVGSLKTFHGIVHSRMAGEVCSQT